MSAPPSSPSNPLARGTPEPLDAPAAGPIGATPLERILLRALLEHLPDSIYFKDRESRFIRVNTAKANKTGGRRPAELVGQTDFDHFTAEHAQPAFDAEQRIIATGEALLDCVEKETWADGHETWVSTTKLPLRDFDGTIIGTFGISHDISDRHHAEEALRRSEATFRGLLTSAPIGISVVHNRTILTFNPMMVQITGYAPEAIIGRPARILYLDDDEYLRVGLLLYATTPPQAVHQPVESVWQRKDGTTIHVEMSAAPLDPDDPAVGMVVTAIDITQRKRAEAEHAAMEAQLNLAHKLESVGRLAAGIAHEINTPGQFVADNLRFLSLSFQQLARYFASVQDLRTQAAALPQLQSQLAEVAEIEKEIELGFLQQEIPGCITQSLDGMARISRIIGALKDFAHPHAASRTPTDLATLIETAAAVSRHEWKYVAEFTTEFDPKLGQVPVVVDELNQALLNLIINAAHAIAAALKQRGETKGCITARTRATPTHAVIEIEDTGTGIPEAARAHLFEPFFTTKGFGAASGQGLHLVHTIVRRMGGHIEYTTALGRGTTFSLLLPLDPGDTVPPGGAGFTPAMPSPVSPPPP